MEAQAAVLGRTITWAEAAWLRYSAVMPDWYLLCHSFLASAIVFLVMPLPLLLLEQLAPAVALRYKLQPQMPSSSSPAAILRYIRSNGVSMLLVFVPHLLLYLVTFKIAGIRTGIPLPSVGEMVAKVVVYALLEDYLAYWIHRFLHTRWGPRCIMSTMRSQHPPLAFTEFTITGLTWSSEASLAGPVIVPCHVTTHWLWYAIRSIETIESHCGYDFPFNPTKIIPFYGGAEFHDYHHQLRHSNYATFFTYCDYIYGTDKGYRYHKASLAEKKLAGEDNMEKRGSDQLKQE